jgi:phosphopantothenoylcysteine synthetase/decarboxylase
MYKFVIKFFFDDVDVMIAAAAVADYKPKNSFEPSRKKKIVR